MHRWIVRNKYMNGWVVNHRGLWAVSVLPCKICGINRRNAKVALGETLQIARGLALFWVLEENSRIWFGRNGKTCYACSPGWQLVNVVCPLGIWCFHTKMDWSVFCFVKCMPSSQWKWGDVLKSVICLKRKIPKLKKRDNFSAPVWCETLQRERCYSWKFWQ